MKKNTRFIGVILVALTMGVLYYCGSNSSTNTEPPPTVKEDPSFSSDIQSIFSNNCISSGCHNAGASNDATNSHIVIKLEGRQTNGGRMPLGGTALHANTIQNIKNWINRGAKNN
jgi:hypothetical protein